MEAKQSAIKRAGDDGDDDHFFSLVLAAEADALASKRRRTAPPSGNAVVSISASNVPEREDLYMAALKGDQSLVRPRPASHGLNDTVASGGGGGGGDLCFKCGKSGHWARDCGSGGGRGQIGNFGGGGADSDIAEKSCPCGSGICIVLTANTEKNRGRKFYKCPLRQEIGGCGFFEWCGNASGGNSSMAGASYGGDSLQQPSLQCPCGGGFCVVLTAKTGKNIGQQFYRCPSNQGSSCGFFKWCNENTPSVSLPATASKVFYNPTDTSNTSHTVRTGSSCFKCGKEGHWARDCSSPLSNPPAQLGGKSASTGTCNKCGKAGHWSRDCSFS